MKRLADRFDDGTVGVFDIFYHDIFEIDAYVEDIEASISISDAIEKLAKYEDTGLEPDEVADIINILNENNDGWGNEEILEIILELAQYKKTGLTPKEIEELKIKEDKS